MELGGFVRTGGDIAGTAQRHGGEDAPPIARFPASLRARETIDRVAEKRYNNQRGGRSGEAKVNVIFDAQCLPPLTVDMLCPGGGEDPLNCEIPCSSA